MLFRDGPRVEDELQRLAELERDCCAFASWSAHTRGDNVVLDVRADSDQGIAAVQAMFNDLRWALPNTDK